MINLYTVLGKEVLNKPFKKVYFEEHPLETESKSTILYENFARKPDVKLLKIGSSGERGGRGWRTFLALEALAELTSPNTLSI